ncbi:MAG: putative sulfate exporter family transporter, partial [Lysobacter sp.]|nr:putative sulfate exporter family transporter [Lysobacter sp.]
MSSRSMIAALPGLAVALALGLMALAATQMPQLAQWQLSALTVAIVLGMLLGNLARPGTLSPLRIGMHVSQRQLLRAGVVLYGLRL